jgi:3'(2'), 5'-bisphosphate nucleotidase
MGAADRSESDHQPLPDLIETFENAAIAAGREILAARAAGARVSIKSDSTPVTQADRAAEAIILARLTEQFPDVPVVAEEMAEDGKCPNSTQASYFLVDALDGTGDFIAGRNEFTVNVALIRDLKPVAGVVYAPALGRIWSGAGLKAHVGRSRRRARSATGGKSAPAPCRKRRSPSSVSAIASLRHRPGSTSSPPTKPPISALR